jgi:hypothetical protein
VRKVLIAVVALIGVTIITVATVALVTHFTTAPKTDSAVEHAYVAATKSFPIPLPKGESYPHAAPAQPADVVYQKGYGASFVSFYLLCAWSRTALAANASHDRAAASEAVSMVAKWDDLPVSVSQADNSDGGFAKGVVEPAQVGKFAALEGYVKSSCTAKFYQGAGR